MRYLIWNLMSVIKNGLVARKKTIVFPYTSLCNQILIVLYKEGFISGFRLLPGRSHLVEVFLKYHCGKPVVSRILSVSKPSKRVYISVSDLWRFQTSLQLLVLSTSKGVLSDKDCRKFHTGGELLCVLQ